METLPITARSFEKDYFVDGDNYEKAYKNHLSGFREWSELEHSDEWLVFPENSIIAIVRGTKAKEVIKALEKIPEMLRMSVVEVTLDFSDSMHSIVEKCFPNAMRTLDRFHHQQFCLEALQEVRREYRREQMTKDANDREEHRLRMKELAKNDGPWIDEDGNPIRRNAKFYPKRLENEETRAELLARSKGLLMMSPNKWTDTACRNLVQRVSCH